MKYEEFIKEIAKQIENKLGEESEIIIKKITKNNNVILDGITIRKDQESISPTIYLNQYYTRYVSGEAIFDIVREIIHIYETNRVEKAMDVSFFSQFENVKNRIVFKLIHFESNKSLLEQIPYIRFLDLAIVFYCFIQSDTFGAATILIHHSHIQLWEKDCTEIFRIAKRNSIQLLQYQIKRIEDVLKEEEGDTLAYEEHEGDISMYVLSNQLQLNGAACMVYPDVLKDLSRQLQCDLFILPSSIHELIILPYKGDCEAEELKDLVNYINHTHVEVEEILSYSIYLYVKAEDKLYIM